MNNQVDIENYLLGEMGDEQRNELEDRIFADDEYFFELCETENELVDQYTAGNLEGIGSERFSRAVKENPNLARKAANARILGDLIRSERESELPVTARSIGFWDRIRTQFTLASAPSFALGGVFLVLAAACGFLYVENGRRNAEIARLESELSTARSSGRESELETALIDSKVREGELQVQIDEERDNSGDLASDLVRERENRRRLERDIATLRKPGAAETASPIETVTVLRLDANSATGTDVPQLNDEGVPERVSLLISVPGTIPAGARVSLRLNGREIARNITIRPDRSGGQVLSAVIHTRQLTTGQNMVTVHDSAGKQLTSYNIEGGPKK